MFDGVIWEQTHFAIEYSNKFLKIVADVLIRHAAANTNRRFPGAGRNPGARGAVFRRPRAMSDACL